MSRLRGCAAIVVLAWLFVGIAAQARPLLARDAGGDAAHASAPCHPASHPEAPAGERPASDPAPCQWPMPLLCCQDVAAVGAGSAVPTPPPALWLGSESPLLAAPSGPAVRSAAEAIPFLPSPLRSSVVLQL